MEATNEDIFLIREDILTFQIKVEKRFNANILWIVGTGIASVGLIFTLIKIFLVK
jgi:hypothetical protein